MSDQAATPSGESPLVPNRVMQRIYQGMVESRLLEERIVRNRKRRESPRIQGQEACRASVLVGLSPEDFVSDLPGVVSSAWLHGAELASILGGEKKKKAKPALPTGFLPVIADTAQRLHVAAGIAMTLKRQKQGRMAVVFADHKTRPALWREVLSLAAREDLPMLFVSLPAPASRAEKGKKQPTLNKRASSAGVPCIPVDASDAVALYRVAQESIGRARIGGGPVVVECVRFAVKGQPKSSAPDPIEAMRQMLLARKVCEEDWMDSIARSFQKQLDRF